MLNKLLFTNSFEAILILAPPTSPLISDVKTLLIPIFLIILVSKKCKEIFLYSGSLEGKGKPFKVVELYLSPRPLTTIFLEPFDTPAVFVTAPSALETPFTDNSCAPIDVFIATAFFCSSINAEAVSLEVKDLITTSSKETPSSADIISLIVIDSPASITKAFSTV